MTKQQMVREILEELQDKVSEAADAALCMPPKASPTKGHTIAPEADTD